MLGLGIGRVALTGRRAAALDLNFMSGAFDSRISFSRPSSATRVNAQGLLESVASGAPRIDYDPVTLACRGLLVEEQRTNLLWYSSQFDDAGWTKAQATISANAAIAPDGTLTADKIVEASGGAAQHALIRGTTIAANTTHTASIFVKAGERPWARITFTKPDFTTGVTVLINLSTGAISGLSNFGAASGAAAVSRYFGSGWWRVELSGLIDSTSTSGAIAVYPHNGSTDSYAGDGSSGIYGWGGGIEPGPFATSHIPTAGAQATRAADLATLALGAWFNAAEGALWGEGMPISPTVSTNQYLAEISDGTSANRLILNRGVTPGAEAYVIVAGANTPLTGLAAWPAATAQRVALAYRVNDMAAAAGGGAPVSPGAIAVPAGLNVLTIGNGAGASYSRAFNGHVRRLRYYRSRLANAQLQALTS